MRRSLSLQVILATWLATAVAAQTARPQPGSLELQRRAVARIDAVVDQFRRNGGELSIAELRQAEVELAASNRALAAGQEWSALAFGLTKQGHVPRMQGQWQNAIVLYQAAQDAALRGRDIVRQSDALGWRALAESSSGRNLGDASAHATEAVRLAAGAGDADVLARALDVLGSVQIAQLNLAAAADTISREIAVAERAADPTAPYYAYWNRSDVYLKLAGQCDYNRTFDACLQALDRAQADLVQASAIVQKLGYRWLVQQTQQSIGDVSVRRALVESKRAETRSTAATTIFQPKRAADVLVTDTFVTPPQPVPPDFAALVQSSRQIEKQFAAFADVVEARNHFTDGAVAELEGRSDAALASYMKAIDALERDRRSLRDESSRGTFAADRINFYYAAVQQLLERRRYADAFSVLERSRSRALVDLLASRTLGLGRPQEQKLYAESTLLRTQIADAQSSLFELASQADARSGPRLATLNARIRSLEQQQQQVTARIAMEAPRLQALVDSKPATLDALQDAMRRERFEVLQYLVVESGVIVWHIGPSSVTVRNVFLPRTQLMIKVASLQKSVSDRQAAFDSKTARELFLFLIQPVLAEVRSERLVVIPHEDLSYVPFQVFQDPADGRYLGERFDVSYAPSASLLLGLKRSTALAGSRLYAVADPGIVSAGGEVNAISKLFPGRARTVTDTLASESDVKASVGDADVVHLSVHGKFNASEPMLSYVALAPGGSDDGRLTAAEMFGLPLDRSRLVVLSACETGRAEATHGNEVLGLVRALIYAGASTLVLSYWEVDSDATALWMRSFYEAAQTRPVAEASRVALTRVKSNPAYSHPYYWAAFGMVGR